MDDEHGDDEHGGDDVKPAVKVGLTAAAALLIGAVAWFFGLDVPHSTMIAFAVAAIALTWIAVQEGEAQVWPTTEHRRAEGGRRDLQSLGWSMKTRGGVHDATLGRVRETARHRLLFLYGLDLYDSHDRAAIETVLAPWAVTLLTTTRHATLDLATFTRCLTAVEAIGGAAAGVRGPSGAARTTAPDARPGPVDTVTTADPAPRSRPKAAR